MSLNLKSSDRLVDAIKALEGFTPVAKHLAADRLNVITGGYGDTNVTLGETFSEAEAEARLRERLAHDYEPVVNDNVRVDLTQGQFDALVSFVYNVGVRAFLTSTLRQKLNEGHFYAAALEFPKWNTSDGQIRAGLVKRRAVEMAWFVERQPTVSSVQAPEAA